MDQILQSKDAVAERIENETRLNYMLPTRDALQVQEHA